MKKLLLTTSCLAALVSFPIYIFTDVNFWVSFSAALSVQIAAWICFVTVVKTHYIFKMEKLRSEEFVNALKQTIRCKCAYCKTENDHLINLQKSVQTFRCKKCEKNNRVIFNFEIAQISDSHNIS